MSDFILQRGFHQKIDKSGYIDLNFESATDTTKPKTPRPWQSKARRVFGWAARLILAAPTACGKSFLICCLVILRLCKHKSQRAIVAVPQTLIGKSFGFDRIRLDGEVHTWAPLHNLCEGNGTRLQALLDFLSKPRDKDFNDRILICSHQTLVAAFKWAVAHKKQSLFKNLFIVIDEAHHCAYGETFLKREVTNGIGSVVQYALREPTVQLGLATATPYRGDRFSIVPKKHLGQFRQFKMALDEYLVTCKHLETIGYDFILYSWSWQAALTSLLDEHSHRKLVIYPPPVGSRCSLGSKQLDVAAIICAIAGCDNPVIADTDKPVMRVQRGNRWIYTNNLVDDYLRNEKKDAIDAAHQHPTAEKIDVIIALGMFHEGANWQWGDRMIIIGPRNSLSDINQMMGRVLRDAEGKKHVHIYQLLPKPDRSKESMQENLNDYLKAVVMSQLLENAVQPVRLTLPSTSSKPAEPRSVKSVDFVDRIFDENELVEFMVRVHRELELSDTSPFDDEARKQAMKVVEKVMHQLGKTKFVREWGEHLLAMIIATGLRRTRAQQRTALNVHDIDFQIIKEHPFGYLLGYTSGPCGISRFKEFRVAARGYEFFPFEQARSVARELKLKNSTDYTAWCHKNKHARLPCCPHLMYKEFTTWSDWLGRGSKWLTFDEARNAVRNRFPSVGKFQLWHKAHKPAGIPQNANKVYEDKWQGWSDFLGTTFRTRPLPFKQAREQARLIVKKHSIKSADQWYEWWRLNRPRGIPCSPIHTYKEFKSMGDWLGIRITSVKNRKFVSFKKARDYVVSAKLKGKKAWNMFCRSGKRPEWIPATPFVVYKGKGWKGMAHWLGTDGKTPSLPFMEARALVIKDVKKHGIRSFLQWRQWYENNRTYGVPRSPHTVYRNKGWKSYKDWIGIVKDFRSVRAKARQAAKRNKLQSARDWKKWWRANRPTNGIPCVPEKTYKHQGWAGWPDWLGCHKTFAGKQTISKFKGVYWHKGDRKWQARYQVDGKITNVGSFNTENEAANAVANARRVHKH